MSIYGKYEAYLPQAMEMIVSDIEKFNHSYKQKYGENAYEHFIYRIKDEQNMCEKCERQSLPLTPESALDTIHDAIGLRIICNFVNDIYDTINYIKALPHITVFEEKDYIKNAKPNGYRSYHMILQLETPFEDVNGNTPGHYFVEIQLRTIAMDSWAALEHRVKYKKNLSDANLSLITSELKRCADELAACDLSMQTIRNLIRSQNGGIL